ncbi:Aste57867_14512 [Aphanomyces stellatus]|uniref:glucan endo-1,3-beta-D-glucosidase n=1 Tax=Aphanomyces stellatus TaxID=120398 RepID=A0A485L0U0_9STRA|nr:hypothetical protein As57867_014458 [Aphanomyces stellatus]VFT91334.1 Aste57867_14512 [Aphanomyces stellatus]
MKVLSCLSFLAAAAFASVAALDTKFYALNYDTRSNEWGGVKTAAVMDADFAALKKVTDVVRVYSMNLGTTKQVLSLAAKNNLKVWLGLWTEIPTDKLKDTFESEFANLKALVEQGLVRNDNVVGIHVSSEAMFRYYIQGPGAGYYNSNQGPAETNSTGADLLGLNTVLDHLHKARAYLRDVKKLTFPLVITDVMDMYAKFPVLYDEVDVVGGNQFSMWEHAAAVDGAHITFQRFQEEQVRAKRAGHPIVIHETGWSSGGENPMVAEASPTAQAQFAKDFLKLVQRQNIKTYYFSSFDLGFGTNEIEKTFGIHNVTTRQLKPDIANITIGKAPEAVRLYIHGVAVKVERHWNPDNTKNDNFGRLYADAPSSGKSGILDDEIFLWDDATKMLYAKSADVCLDAYGDKSHQTVHTYYCQPGNVNQQWSFQNANIANQNDANWCLDVDMTRAKTTDGKLVVEMWPCAGNQNQFYDIVKATEDPVEFSRANGTTFLATTVSGAVTVANQSSSAAWFYDPVGQHIASQSSKGLCLDAAERQNGTKVALTTCNATSLTQRWVYNDITGQLHHDHHLNFCLDVVKNDVSLWTCDKTKQEQLWDFTLVRTKPTAAVRSVHARARQDTN